MRWQTALNDHGGAPNSLFHIGSAYATLSERVAALPHKVLEVAVTSAHFLDKRELALLSTIGKEAGIAKLKVQGSRLGFHAESAFSRCIEAERSLGHSRFSSDAAEAIKALKLTHLIR